MQRERICALDFGHDSSEQTRDSPDFKPSAMPEEFHPLREAFRAGGEARLEVIHSSPASFLKGSHHAPFETTLSFNVYLMTISVFLEPPGKAVGHLTARFTSSLLIVWD